MKLCFCTLGFVLAVGLFSPFFEASAQRSGGDNLERQSTRPPPRKAAPKQQQRPANEKGQRPAPRSGARPSEPPASAERGLFALGIQAGWEAPIGNALVLHMVPSTMLDLAAGVGYNTSGLKVGLTGRFLLPMSPTMGMQFGAGASYSAGTKDSVSLDAKFTPEGSNAEEDLVVTREYELSSALLANVLVGGHMMLTDTIRVSAELNYNIPLSGNEVTFLPGIRYDKPVEVANEEPFNEQFETKAQERVKSGGIGALIGLALFL